MAHVHLGKFLSREKKEAGLFVLPKKSNLSVSQFIQYILLTPTYINVLNIYAFCNTHDITWGTKGDDKAEKLPSATLKPGGKVDVNIPQDDGDLNAQYEAELAKFASKPPKEVHAVSEEDRQADYYKGFRSAVVLAWVFCNFALGAVVLSAAGLETFDNSTKTSSTNQDFTQSQRSLIYMEVVLWSVAGLSLFKFMGAMWFLVVRMVSFSVPLMSLSDVSLISPLTRHSSVAFEIRPGIVYCSTWGRFVLSISKPCVASGPFIRYIPPMFLRWRWSVVFFR